MAKKKAILDPHAPLRVEGHGRPVTRRDFLAQGLIAGNALVLGPSLLGMMLAPRGANATLAPDMQALLGPCGIATAGAGKIPFIAIDLSGGANIAGSNVLVGGPGGQLDFLSTAGYNKLGLPGDMAPNVVNAVTGTSDFVDTRLGLAFHSDSAMLRGIMSKVSADTASRVNGVVLPARSENDTANNPHNPMYGINKAGANGDLLTLIGSRSSDSGGNSIAPAMMVDVSVRPTKIDRPSDVTGLVDTGDLVGLLNQTDAVAVMESVTRLSQAKLGRVTTTATPAADTVIKNQMVCNYAKSASLVDRYGNPQALNPLRDAVIESIFPGAELTSGDGPKVASVMKLVVNGYAGAGTIEMGGYDYHTGDRSTGEARDFRAGVAIGACLEYAARVSTSTGVGVPVMIYVFSDGSVASNGRIDDSVGGRGKGEWTGDNSSTACSFFLVYNPAAKPVLQGGTVDAQLRHQQIGFMRSDASVETSATPGANNVNLLVETVVLNYMALHGEQNNFALTFPQHGLGSVALRDSLTAFTPIVNGRVGVPPV